MSENVRSKKVDKEYYVQVDGIINQEAIQKMKEGVEIGFEVTKYITKPCESFIINEIPDFGPRGKKIRDERHGQHLGLQSRSTKESFVRFEK